MEKNIQELTDEELVEIAGKTVIGTQSGLNAQYAQAELTRRLMKNIANLTGETAMYSKVLVGLTLLLAVVAVFQLATTVVPASAPGWYKLVLLNILLVISLYLGMQIRMVLNLKRKK